MTADLIWLCLFDRLEDGRSRGFDPLNEGRDTMFVVRKGDRLYAYRNACPHYDFAFMAWKKDEYMNGDHSQIMCSAHGAMFQIEDGSCTIGPCLGQSLRAVPIVIQGGEVLVVGPYAPGRRRSPLREQQTA